MPSLCVVILMRPVAPATLSVGHPLTCLWRAKLLCLSQLSSAGHGLASCFSQESGQWHSWWSLNRAQVDSVEVVTPDASCASSTSIVVGAMYQFSGLSNHFSCVVASSWQCRCRWRLRVGHSLPGLVVGNGGSSGGVNFGRVGQALRFFKRLFVFLQLCGGAGRHKVVRTRLRSSRLTCKMLPIAVWLLQCVAVTAGGFLATVGYDKLLPSLSRLVSLWQATHKPERRPPANLVPTTLGASNVLFTVTNAVGARPICLRWALWQNSPRSSLPLGQRALFSQNDYGLVVQFLELFVVDDVVGCWLLLELELPSYFFLQMSQPVAERT